MTEPAYAHYTVDRKLTESEADPKRTFVQALRWGWRGVLRRVRARGVLIDPRVAVAVNDTVRILDRDGTVVWSRTFDQRDRSEESEAKITSDLLELPLDSFREAYGIGGQAGVDRTQRR